MAFLKRKPIPKTPLWFLYYVPQGKAGLMGARFPSPYDPNTGKPYKNSAASKHNHQIRLGIGNNP